MCDPVIPCALEYRVLAQPTWTPQTCTSSPEEALQPASGDARIKSIPPIPPPGIKYIRVWKVSSALSAYPEKFTEASNKGPCLGIPGTLRRSLVEAIGPEEGCYRCHGRPRLGTEHTSLTCSEPHPLSYEACRRASPCSPLDPSLQPRHLPPPFAAPAPALRNHE